jgi:phytoene dehydrogenase-like protein
LFRSLPRVVAVNSGSALYVAGDSVFPGQGVIAASMSGVIAWSIMTGKSPRVHLSQLSSW